jgi:hypothetical protein
VRLGRIKGILAGICVLGRPEESFPAGPEQPSPVRPASRPAVPGWADLLGPPAGPGRFTPAGPVQPWAGAALPRRGPLACLPLGRQAPAPAGLPSSRAPASSNNPAGPLAAAPAGPAQFPGWAAARPPGRLSQADIPSPGRDSLYRLGWLLSTIPAGPGRDCLAQAGLLLSQVDIHLLWHTLPVQHQLQRLVPVLGRL